MNDLEGFINHALTAVLENELRRASQTQRDEAWAKAHARPGDGAKFVYFRQTKNRHVIGYNTTPDRFGKWYAVEYVPRRGKGNGRHLKRMVKCATRKKALAKCYDWLNDAAGYPRVSAK